MTSIMCLTETFWRNEFRCNYLKNKKLFLNFFFDFQNLKLILNSSQKKMTLIGDIFGEISAPKKMVRSMSKKPCFRGPLDREDGKSVKTMFQS